MSVEEEIAQVKQDIAETKAEIAEIKAKIKKAEEAGNEEKLKVLREDKKTLDDRLNKWIEQQTELQKKEYLILAQGKGGEGGKI